METGITPKTTENDLYCVDGIPWVNSGELQSMRLSSVSHRLPKNTVKELKMKVFPTDTLVMAIYGLEAKGVRGKSSFLGVPACISQSCMAFLPKADSIYMLFFYFFLKAKKDILGVKYAQGTKQQNLTSGLVETFKFCFPSLKEQRRIGFLLELIERRIEAQSKIIEIYSSLINPLFDRLHEGLLMEPTRLMDVAIIKKGEQINGDMMDDSNEFPMLNGGTTPSGFFAKSNRTKETIAISEGGNSCGYVSFMSTPFWAGGHCYTVHPASCGTVLNKYLFYSLKRWERKIMSLRVGSGLPNIQKSDLGNFIFNIPPKKDQEAIAKTLDCINSKLQTEQKYLALFNRLKTFLLVNMFI